MESSSSVCEASALEAGAVSVAMGAGARTMRGEVAWYGVFSRPAHQHSATAEAAVE